MAFGYYSVFNALLVGSILLPPAQTKLLNRSTKRVRISKSEQKRQTNKLYVK